MPFAEGGQEQLQNREEVWESFPEDWENAPEWCTLTPSESLQEWKQVLSDVHDIEPDLVLQWCDLAADGSALGHVEATKILSQFFRDAKPNKTNPIRKPSGYMRKNLDESRRVITSTLAAPGGVPPYLQNALVQLMSWKQQNPMSPASPAVVSLTGRAARDAEALHAAEAGKGKGGDSGKGGDPAWSGYRATTNAWDSRSSNSGDWRSGSWWGQHSWNSGGSWASGAAGSSSSTWAGTGWGAAPAAPAPPVSWKGGRV